MRLNRSKNAMRNVGFGIANKIINIVFPFAIRTVFIHTLGTEYLGLNSLFSSILTVLNLTELGFSSAIVFCMYKPIAEDDEGTIDALLLLYKKIYRIVGFIILIVGLLLMPFLPFLIKGDYPGEINIRIVYIVFLINTVLSYFLFAYLGALISAFQREDILSRVNIFIRLVMYISQIIILLTIKNYYFYILVLPIFTIINNIRTALIAKKVFPQYHPAGVISQEIKDEIKIKVKGLMIEKISIVTRNAFDSIFISMFLGLTATAIYNNYYYVMNAVILITNVFCASTVAGAGNSVVLDSAEKNYSDMIRLNFIYMWLCGWLTICLLCLYQPFMFIWVGTKLMYPFECVILICIYFYILKMSDIRYIYELAKGLWWECRYRAISEAATNLVLNYFLGKIFGIYGIMIATIISIFFINFLYGTTIIFKCYFKKESIRGYFLNHLVNAVITVAVGCMTYFVCSVMPSGVAGFFIRVTICLVLPNILFWLCYHRTDRFKEAVPWLLGKIGRGIQLTH